MKKIFLLSLIFCFFSIIKSEAQCTPDTTITTPGIYPKNLPDAKEDSIYDEVIQFRMPKDTQSFLGLVKFDSISIISISGIPSGITYDCNPNPGFSGCTWAGGTNGCLRVHGTPDSGMAGIHQCVIKLRAYVFIAGNVTFFETKDTLLFNVHPAQRTNGIITFLNTDLTIFPNPATQKLYISGGASILPEAIVSLYNISGSILGIYKWADFVSQGLDTHSMPPGVYILRIADGNNIITARFQR